MTDPIELPEDQVGAVAEAPTTTPSSLLETMLQALEAPLGIEMEFPDKASALRTRFRFYDERNKLRSQGNRHFDELVFTIDGKKLKITQFALPKVREIK